MQMLRACGPGSGRRERRGDRARLPSKRCPARSTTTWRSWSSGPRRSTWRPGSHFPAEPIRVSEARRLAHETFLAWGMELEQADLTCLLVSEVVTNVVLHAAVSPTPRHEFVFEPQARPIGNHSRTGSGSPFDDRLTVAAGKEFTLRLRRGSASVWVEVFDADLRLPRIRTAGETDEGGRGLYLVDQLATRWGSRPTNEGKAVWFEMPIKGRLRPAADSWLTARPGRSLWPLAHFGRSRPGPGGRPDSPGGCSPGLAGPARSVPGRCPQAEYDDATRR